MKKPYILTIYYYNRPGHKDETLTKFAFCRHDNEAKILAHTLFPDASKIEIEKFLELK